MVIGVSTFHFFNSWWQCSMDLMVSKVDEEALSNRKSVNVAIAWCVLAKLTVWFSIPLSGVPASVGNFQKWVLCLRICSNQQCCSHMGAMITQRHFMDANQGMSVL